MGERLKILLGKLTAGYWFIPTVMALSAVALAYLGVRLDAAVEDDTLASWWLSYTGGPAGARSVLSTIASSMINVAGVVFSITVVVLSLATQQFGTYILRSFLRDKGNQVVLGAFVATYLYCLLVLRSVRGGDGLTSSSFVPYISVTLALLLAVISLGLLIFFIHHLARSIRSSNLVARAGAELVDSIGRLFPEEIGEAFYEDPSPPQLSGQSVKSPDAGYLEGVDGEKLMSAAVDSQVVIVVRVQPGDFVATGDELALVSGKVDSESGEPVAKAVRAAFILGSERTIDQDISFGIETLVELAVRGLSPGINNTVTAVQCIDQLREGFSRLMDRKWPAAARKDGDGVARVYAAPRPFEELLDGAFGRLIFSAQNQPDVLLHLLQTLEALSAKAQGQGRSAAEIDTQVQRIRQFAGEIKDSPFRAKLRSGLSSAAYGAEANVH